ncbi:hypothetical protein FE257_012158 [Aspergillus nanangensis]|uniref:Phosphatidic acid phosphatase type 2/haloperoxidase domain-containing protein n=1 Tax=Aspergillus nanangensis TaxID=2582783 RepID=A0AAD4CGC0_ASPNN|nr:hypothetical protein FE257_012158 [Aspergillus nanangensis]
MVRPFSKESLTMRDAAQRSIPKRLVISYILDWIMIVGIALIGYGFYKTDPTRHPFSLTDETISFPYRDKDTVSTAVLVVVSLVVPAAFIVIGALLLIPGSAAAGTPSRSQLWLYKIWEWNAGWLGLGLSVAGTFMATMGLKSLYGKPRPDLLARCNPDLSRIAEFTVGGLGGKVTGAPRLVSWEICQNQAYELAVDGFASFPSGHSSFAFAGLTYLSLWLCSKLSIGFPYLAHSPFGLDLRAQKRDSIRMQGAAPPVYMVIVAFVPIAVAFFFSASRWFDFRHHGFDIIFGSVMGIVFAWVAFHLYHLPIMRGAGWAWAARSHNHAFFKGVGLPSYVGANDWSAVDDKHVTVDSGQPEVDIERGERDLAE